MTLDAENGMVKDPAAGADLKAHEWKHQFILRYMNGSTQYQYFM